MGKTTVCAKKPAGAEQLILTSNVLTHFGFHTPHEENCRW